MPAGRYFSSSIISLLVRHPRRLSQKKSQSIVICPTLRSKRSLLQLIFLTNRFCLNYGGSIIVFLI